MSTRWTPLPHGLLCAALLPATVQADYTSIKTTHAGAIAITACWGSGDAVVNHEPFH